ncbi:type IX secretion system outer membrane channel protein PorV [Pontibacter sp. G13]|uniref:type IX secretion system outer membrane channel protein PorV n=1 Tax=Pontibacter sp. G13 TaxID=3074898 RepID=UPI0028899C23|nr:type IX secretion system outer membrane channel protein PorV [Pontibacter sp. G13]WNJ15961.1 type IX secretion system outer membrane channel protein PorV [Pontibacter sp. G13]
MMRKAFLAAACLTVLGFGFGNKAQAQTEPSKTITTAVPLLLISPDSRGGALGDAGVAITDDANAMHWNPSALAFIDNRMGFAMSYSPWLQTLGIPDINLMYLSGYYNTGNAGVIGSSLRYFSLGEIKLTGNNGEPLGVDKPNEFAFDVGYSLKISESLSGGIALRYIYSRLSSNSVDAVNINPVHAVAGDISFMYKKDFTINGASDIPVTFTSGVNISNIGPKVSYTGQSDDKDFLPTNLRIGYAFRFFLDEYNSFTFTNDFNKLLVPSPDSLGMTPDQSALSGMFGSFGDAPGGFGEELSEINLSFGAEYWYRDLFAARVGYFYEHPDKGNRQYITLGLGIRYNVFGLDFSYLAPLQQNHPLQNTLRFTLSYNFNESGAE